MDVTSYILGKKSGLKVEVVLELPTVGEENILYLVPKQDTGESDIFDEWLYIEDEWEHIGSADIDLSNYYTKDEVYNKTQVDAKIPYMVSSVYLNNTELSTFDSNTTILNLKTTGLYIIYNTNTSWGPAKYEGFLSVTNNSGYVTQYLTLFYPDVNGNVMYARRQIQPNGSKTLFATNYKMLNPIDRIPALSTTNYEQNCFTTIKGLASYFGTKTITNLTTTNKASIVDAINEVNSKIGDINTVLATLTTPTNGGN